MKGYSYQRGFGAIAAIVVLVMLAALSAAIVSFGTGQQLALAQDLLSARASLAARSGGELGLYRALRQGVCVNEVLDLFADTGFYVAVTCDVHTYKEGESSPGVAQTVKLYEIRAVACPAPACPAAIQQVTGPGYVERSRVVFATDR